MSDKYPFWSSIAVETQMEKVRYFVDGCAYLKNDEGMRQEMRLMPKVPDFVPCSPTEILMLAVYFNDSWVKGNRNEKKLVKKDSPDDKFSGLCRTVYNWLTFIPLDVQLESIVSEKSLEELNLIPDYTYRPGVRWVGFDPFSYQNMDPLTALRHASSEGRMLAGPEVLMSIALFPDLVHSEGGMRAASMAALRFSSSYVYFSGHTSVPCIQYIPRHYKVHPTGWLEVSRDWDNSVARGNCYCPTVRDL